MSNMSSTDNIAKTNKSQDLKGLGFLAIKALFVLVLASFLMIVYKGQDAKDIDLKVVNDALKSDSSFTQVMKDQNERDLMQFIGLNANDYEQVYYYRNTEALAVEEFLVVKTKDPSMTSSVEAAVNKRIESQIKAYDSYGPAQVRMLKGAAVKSVGRYVIYCTSSDADKYEEVVLDAIQ